jgi:hypothetical protein
VYQLSWLTFLFEKKNCQKKAGYSFQYPHFHFCFFVNGDKKFVEIKVSSPCKKSTVHLVCIVNHTDLFKMYMDFEDARCMYWMCQILYTNPCWLHSITVWTGEAYLEALRAHRQFVVLTSARNGPVFAGIPYRNFLLFLSFIPALLFSKNTYRYCMFLNNASEKWGI